ncbi:MAG: winged helix-turn-helix transcriptional regulator [Gaiellaceae bacterium]
MPEEVCSAADLLERRWLLSLLWALDAGLVRFNEFKQALEGIPPRTLTLRLSELEQAGLVDRTVIDARPPRVEYRLTPDGERLGAVVKAVSAWAAG